MASGLLLMNDLKRIRLPLTDWALLVCSILAWPTSTEKFRTDIIMAINIPMIYGYGRAARQSRRMVDRGERRFGLVWRFVAKS